MRKSTLILSTILTGAVLVILFGLASAYQKATQKPVADDTSMQVQEQSTEEVATEWAQAAAENQSAPVAAVDIYDATAMAAKVLGHDDVYLSEYAQLDGADVYLVTFLSGDLVYVSLDGQIISASKQGEIRPSQLHTDKY